MNNPIKAPHLNPRQKEILHYVRKNGEVQVDPVAEIFNVSPQTIRRDLNHLRRLGLLQRVHGGAVVHDGVANLGYEARRHLAVEEKAAIGERAASLISDDTSLFVNIGTTTEAVARYLVNHIGLLVITNNINVINTLIGSETIQLMTAGGSVRREDGGIIGDDTAEFFQQFKVDLAVVGASAIDEDGSVLDYDVQEVRVAKAIIENARSVMLVADAMKFQRSAPMRISGIGRFDYFVTDRAPPEKFGRLCREKGVEVVISTGVKPARGVGVG